jgi:uncharacterized membrane protein
MSKKILIAGESWTSYTTHIKGVDTFRTSLYQEGVSYLRGALEKAGYEIHYVPNHAAQDDLPFSTEEFGSYAAVILSDIGSNTLLLPTATFAQSQRRPNRCDSIRDYVLNGGALLMIGGYMSFTGIDATARYGSTSIADVLPVSCLPMDDRREHPEGIVAKVTKSDHPLVKGISGEWPFLLGYNKTVAKPGCEVAVEIDGDPLIAAGDFGKGRAGIFASDCSPHWAPPEFVSWRHYDTIWANMLSYLIR